MEITLSMEALYDGILFENPKQPSWFLVLP
jgi:hypothetical protein